MKIINSSISDIETIFSFYDNAVVFQKTKFDKHWLAFDHQMVEKEIEECRQWKMMDGDEVVCIFAITYDDPAIWKEKNNDPSIYIHRIVTHPNHHGKKHVSQIIEWAKIHAKDNNKSFIRMDTWGDNQRLIDYYVECGFTFMGTTTPERNGSLPKHYSAIFLSLFEIILN
jgi:ribosomal protein S18 acetylase RimI-like enzyme